MCFYNRNQIQRMKIKKKQFEQTKTSTMFPENHIEKVIYPFLQQISSTNISVYIVRKDFGEVNLKLDWKNYQLILFNLIQNAIKFNYFNGAIIIVLSVKKKSEEFLSLRSFIEEPLYILETEIIDTGIGISPSRQKLLFVPFLELMLRQNFDAVQDSTIGVGLASSQIITQ